MGEGAVVINFAQEGGVVKATINSAHEGGRC